jgi:hypothetical protein
VDIVLNRNQIFTDSLSAGVRLSDAAQAVIAHELGHVLGVDDVPAKWIGVLGDSEEHHVPRFRSLDEVPSVYAPNSL